MAAPDDCRHPLSAFPADVNNLTSENLNRGQRSPYLQFSTSWQSCGHLPCVRDSSCLGGHGTYLAVQEHIEAISRGFLSEAIRLWWCVLITPSAHSLSLNCLFFSCLSCCLLYVGQPFKCCQSVFVWTPIILALPSHPPPPSSHTHTVIFLFGMLLCWIIWVGVFTITNRVQHSDVNRPGTETRKTEWVYECNAVLQWHPVI